jgi:hypothetical protein
LIHAWRIGAVICLFATSAEDAIWRFAMRNEMNGPTKTARAATIKDRVGMLINAKKACI